jgi:HEAT repeat protein
MLVPGPAGTTHEAIRELGSGETAEALAVLAESAALDDQFLRRTAIEAIGHHPQGRELRNIILRAFGDPSEYVVRTACEVVARWKLNEARDHVLPLLTDISKSTRQTAIRTLDTIWTDEDFPLLFKIHSKDSEIEIRREAARVLREHVTPETWRTLFDVFVTDELPRHRQWACEIAEQFSNPDTLPALSRLSSDPDGHVRKAATRALCIVSARG